MHAKNGLGSNGVKFDSSVPCKNLATRQDKVFHYNGVISVSFTNPAYMLDYLFLILAAEIILLNLNVDYLYILQDKSSDRSYIFFFSAKELLYSTD